MRAERQLGPRTYYCRYGITGEIFPVHVLPGYAGAVADAFEEQGETGQDMAGRACIFLQEDPGAGGFSCAIYPSRPPVCRNFRCYRMLIYDRGSGELRGRVVGKHDLRTEDAALADLWKATIASLPYPGRSRPASPPGSGQVNDREWLDRVVSILAAHGYRGDPAED